MNRLSILLIAMLLLVGCGSEQGTIIITATPGQPTDVPVITQAATNTPQPGTRLFNDNPGLALGSCHDDYFDSLWGQRWYRQCIPQGYNFHQVLCPVGEIREGIPVDANYTGVGYSFLLGGRCGEFGYRFQSTIPQTCIAIKIYGDAHVWGSIGDYSIGAQIMPAGGSGYVKPPQYGLVANGPYMAMFIVDVLQPGVYEISVFLNMLFGSATADSYATIERIEVIPVSTGHCDGVPSI